MPVCPCGSHDVVGITRVTGYMQDLAGMNEGKQREIKDRKRYDI
jgi:anaerobic ribonucleoside-triphosphate reductase